jgi:hypothetical protein
MIENKINCPKCKTEINLDEIARSKYNEELKKNEEKLQEEYVKKEEEMKEVYRKKAYEWAEKKIEEKMKEKDFETKDLKEQLKEINQKREEDKKRELELMKQKRELEHKAKDLEIQNARKLDEERKKIQEELEKSQQIFFEEKLKIMQDDFRKKESEKDKQMENLKKSLDEANRKANQWSQQIQGEILENELKNILIKNFPEDTIEDVPTWIKWADLIQIVKNNRWQNAGIILWESKNTKAWSDLWIKKLKDDRTIVKADICVIVSNIVPEEIKHFGLIKDVWVCEFPYFLALTVAIRDKLLSIYQVSNSLVGKEEKMELLYSYLSSPDFKWKIENIIDAFKSMKEDLESEKRSMSRIWAKREKELERIINNTSYLYWDMQWIMWNALSKIKYLELDNWEE